MELTIQQTAALVVGFIGIAVGGLGSLYCLVLPFRARRHFVYGMPLLWIRAFVVLVLNGLVVVTIITYPPASNHGSFACVGLIYGLLMAMMVFICSEQYKEQKRVRAQELRFQQRVEETFR